MRSKLRGTYVTIAILFIILVSVGAVAYVSLAPKPSPFTMQMIPDLIRGDAIVNQRVVLLVAIADEGNASSVGKAVSISASAPGSAITIYPQSITPGQVAEVVIVPDPTSVGKNMTVTIRGDRDGLSQTRNITFEVIDGEDTLGPYAVEMRDRFIPWLATNHPELSITNETFWNGTIVSPRWLVVSHYLFFSEDWEMHVYWHVMIAPYDWAKIDLRHRVTELSPSFAFEISSVSGNEEPHAIPPPESVWR